MASVFNLEAFKHRATRSSFDLSQKVLFSGKVGECLPVSCEEIIPGDKQVKKPKSFTRTPAVSSPAYTTIREYFDYYFVPTRILWRGFPSWVTQQNTQTHFAASSTTQIELASVQPYFTVKQIHDYLQAINTVSHPNNDFGFSRAQNTVKLLSYLGYGDFSPSVQEANKEKEWSDLYAANLTLNPFPLLAYQAVCDHYHRNVQWQDSHPYLFNVDYMTGTDASSMQMNLTSILPGGTSYVPNYMDLQYSIYHKDYFMGVYPDTQFGSVSYLDASGPGNVVGNVHFMSGDGSIPNNGTSGVVTLVKDESWQDGNFYHLATRNTSNIHNVNQISLTGRDEGDRPLSYKEFSGIGSIVETASSRGLEYMYTSGNNGMITSQSSSIADYNSGQSKADRIFISDADIAGFNILQLRLAEAKQKWAEVTMSNYYDYVSQINAHFGVKPSAILSHSPRYVGGFDGVIGINEVVNTNITGDNKSDMAGKGVGSSGGEIKFDAENYGNEHGYLICIYHAEPLLDWSTNYVLRQNLRSLPTDYAIPEYENVGMQAMYANELTNTKIAAGSGGVNQGVRVLGYGPRYYDYKARFDRVQGIFKKSLDYWTAPVNDDYVSQYFSALANTEQLALTPQWFKINPHLVDNIFGVDADSSVDTDCLLVNYYDDCKASRKLSRFGLPM